MRLHHSAGPLLQSHGPNYMRSRSDELNPRSLTNFGKIGVFAQESITRVNGIDVCDLSRADNGGDIEVASGAFCGPNTNRLVGKTDMQAVPVGFRVNRHRLDT